jgi:4-aminobutyrate--pyruvate transaminase
MATSNSVMSEQEKLPLILGFQRVADHDWSTTRVLDRGRGIYVYDTDGREYIEGTASFYVASLGYQHEELVEAAHAQYTRLPYYTSALHRTTAPSIEIAKRLLDIVPISNAHILFATTGSEAIDFLVKMLLFQSVANGCPERRGFIGRHGSYHGGTLASASLTGAHHEEFGLPLPGFAHVSQPDYHGLREPGESPKDFASRLAAELDALIRRQPQGSVAALFAEPVSFSAGLMVPPAEYFPMITSVLAEHGVTFVVDEVVTGFGRTGALFGSETFDLRPNHVTMAKGITSGYFPLSAIAIDGGLYDDLVRGSETAGVLAHAATFAAHPVGAAVALKTIEIIQRDKLVEHARKMGTILATVVDGLRGHPLVGEVRSAGLAAAIDFLQRDADDRIVSGDAEQICHRVYEHALELGLITRPAGRSLVIAPPLIVREDEILEIGRRIEQSLEAAVSRKSR